MASDDKDLAFPRVVYRGAPDHLGAGNVGETKRVEDQADWDQAKKEGWRLTRDDGKPVPKDPGTISIPGQDIAVDADSVIANQRAQRRAAEDDVTDAARKQGQQAKAEAASAANPAGTTADSKAAAPKGDKGLPAPAKNALGKK